MELKLANGALEIEQIEDELELDELELLDDDEVELEELLELEELELEVPPQPARIDASSREEPKARLFMYIDFGEAPIVIYLIIELL